MASNHRNRNKYYPKQLEVRCDKCSKDFKAVVKPLHHLEHNIIIEGFKCPKCKSEYITLISDNKLRTKMAQVADAKRAYDAACKQRGHEFQDFRSKNRQIPEYIVERWEKKTKELYNTYLTLHNEAKSMEVVLTKAYLKHK